MNCKRRLATLSTLVGGYRGEMQEEPARIEESVNSEFRFVLPFIRADENPSSAVRVWVKVFGRQSPLAAS